MRKRKIAIIGATGSIGRQALDVIRYNRDLYDVVLLTAHQNEAELCSSGKQVDAAHLVLTGKSMDGLLKLINTLEIDVALIGAAGTQILAVAYELALKGVTLAIANKECIVSAGRLICEAAKKSGAAIIPVDSEHSAIFQCLEGHNREEVAQITLTASGGAFRDLPASELEHVPVEAALNHPNWNMGRKITIDSATMMNKGLELIEGRILFDMPPEKFNIVIHPQSIVHSMVSYLDGAVIAQMASADMRLPIAYALGYPRRTASGVCPIDFTVPLSLTFYPPDIEKYRCLKIAMQVLKEDKQAAMITMNAANEVAVNAFLERKLRFVDIPSVIEDTLSVQTHSEPNSISDVLVIDKVSREYAGGFLEKYSSI